MRPVVLRSGGTNYHIDQLTNPDTVIFTPAGLWTEEIVLHGQVATASLSEPSKHLIERFRQQFERHRSRCG